jgi:hypothetical protein
VTCVFLGLQLCLKVVGLDDSRSSFLVKQLAVKLGFQGVVLGLGRLHLPFGAQGCLPGLGIGELND